MKDNKSFAGSQSILIDSKGLNKKDRPKRYNWHIKKKFNELLSTAMRVNPELFSGSKIERVSKCCNYLSFIECPDCGHKKLNYASLCKHPFCPNCQKRRSLKNYHNLLKTLEYVQSKKKYRYILLTLTTPNVHLSELKKEIQHFFKSWGKLVKRREVKRVLKGFVRTLEITRNSETDMYNPHIHALIAVDEEYFDKSLDFYIDQPRWLELWQESTNQPEITQVDVRVIGGGKTEDDPEGLHGICREVSKYITKNFEGKPKGTYSINGDFIKNPDLIGYGMQGHLWIRETPEESGQVLYELEQAVKHQRLFEFGGILKDAKKELKLQDSEDKDADLIHVDDEHTGKDCDNCGADNMHEVVYSWHSDSGNYLLSTSIALRDKVDTTLIFRSDKPPKPPP